jgi:sugar-specific transcriptional regulator TrmB
VSNFADNCAKVIPMSSTSELRIVQKYLQVLDIDPEATRVYIELIKTGPSSVLQLSKTTGISRTQMYRRLEELQAKGLVSVEQLTYGSLFRPLPFENVEALIADRDAEVKTAKHDLGTMAELVKQLAGSNAPKATVQHYYGLAGIKYANWNLTNADKEYKVFEQAHLSQHLDKAFARRHREQCIERGLTSYDLTNDTVASLKDLEPIDTKRSFIRHIDPEILNISFEAYLYNDCVTLLDYTAGNELALEIHHPALKAMMEQLFDAMWNIAEPLEIK